MTARAQLRGLTLSVLLHVGAAAALVAWSTASFTRPLFVDLLERAEPPAARADAPTPASPSVQRPAGRAVRAGAEAPRSFPASAPPAPAAAPIPEPVVPPTPPPAAVVPVAPLAPPPLPAAPLAPPAPAAPPIAATPPTETAPTSPTGPARSAAPDPASGARAAGETRADVTSTAGGAAGAPLALATPGGSAVIPAEYGPFLQRFRERVHEALIYPLAARRQGLGGTVEVDVLLEASGRVRDVRVVRSSSHRLLDEAALETIRGLGPIPFPDSLPRRSLLIRIPLVFELR